MEEPGDFILTVRLVDEGTPALPASGASEDCTSDGCTTTKSVNPC